VRGFVVPLNSNGAVAICADTRLRGRQPGFPPRFTRRRAPTIIRTLTLSIEYLLKAS
jgi:hypothetical protein